MGTVVNQSNDYIAGSVSEEALETRDTPGGRPTAFISGSRAETECRTHRPLGTGYHDHLGGQAATGESLYGGESWSTPGQETGYYAPAILEPAGGVGSPGETPHTGHHFTGRAQDDDPAEEMHLGLSLIHI